MCPIARANLSLFFSGRPAYDRARPGANLAPWGRPVDLWTSPSDRPASCGPWGQTVENTNVLTTA